MSGQAIRRPDESPARLPLLGMVGLALFTLVVVFVARATDVGTLRIQSLEPLVERDLRMKTTETGRLAIVDATNDETLVTVDRASDPVVVHYVRGLAAGRKARAVADDVPYRLVRWDNGVITLKDLGTGQRVVVTAVDAAKADAFQRILKN